MANVSRLNGVLSALVLSVATLAASACAPVIHNHGYVFEDEKLALLSRGATSADQVKQILGTPTTISVIKTQSYFYIYSRFETFTYKKPEEVDRKVLAIYFDEENKIKDYAHYGLDKGNIVAFVERETPTSGKELTFLQQIFGNIGRFDSVSAGGPGGD